MIKKASLLNYFQMLSEKNITVNKLLVAFLFLSILVFSAVSGYCAPFVAEGASLVGHSVEDTLSFSFTGNRIDIITGVTSGKLGTAKILIDNVPPSSMPSLYEYTRASNGYKSWAPAINNIEHNSDIIDEKWTLTLTNINADASIVEYNVSGSVTGPDGSGTQAGTFISDSGRVVIEPSDLGFAWSNQYIAVCPNGFQVTWGVQKLFTDTYKPSDFSVKKIVETVVAAKGLDTGEHTIKIIPNGDGAVPVAGFRVHTPPLFEKITDISLGIDTSSEANNGTFLQRSMGLLTESSASSRNTLKILFYGQSITAQDWTTKLVNKLRAAYPLANIQYENLAIGGYEAPMLKRTAFHDLYPSYADLVIFHVYLGYTTGEVDKMMQLLRQKSACDVIIATHHVTKYGEVGSSAYEEREARYSLESDSIRVIAKRYNLELVDVRKAWTDTLAYYNRDPGFYLEDQIHLNSAGTDLMSNIMFKHFITNKTHDTGWDKFIRTYKSNDIYVGVENNSYNKPLVPELTVHPNPFNNSASINFNLPESSQISLNVYSVTGQKVASLVKKRMNAGTHSVSFDGKDLASGVYFYRFDTGNFSKTGKMLLLK